MRCGERSETFSVVEREREKKTSLALWQTEKHEARSQNNFLPFCAVVYLWEIHHVIVSSYSFFFSFCLSSLLISLLAIDVYFVMTPCWLRPGSSSRKFTIR